MRACVCVCVARVRVRCEPPALRSLRTPLHPHTHTLTRSRAQPLIVVASLIDKAANLGGLARTCEVFAAQALVVRDAGVVADPVYVEVSASAGALMDVCEVRPPALAAYLRSRAAQGYAVVAVEQAALSAKLGEGGVGLPSGPTVLLLGSEREGVPLELLACVHGCVEIPQLGSVRSLNVHVSGALVVGEWTRQRAREAAAAAVGGGAPT